MRYQCLAFIGAALVTFGVGCAPQSQSQSESSSGESKPASGLEGAAFLLADPPDHSDDVIAVRASAENGDEVVIEGRIGGAESPWVEGRGAFTLVDNTLQACSDIPGDGCPKPWDYCCQTDLLPKSTALVKVVDDQGALVNTDARELLDVKELSRVVVKGRAQRDDAGNLTVLATGVYVQER